MAELECSSLDKIYEALQKKRKMIAKNEAYVLGENPYIMQRELKKKPDNRIPVPLAKIAVEDMSGYAGRAGSIDVTYDLVSTDTEDDEDPFIGYMRTMDAYNNEDLETAELYEEVLNQGESFELWYTSEEVNVTQITAEYKIVPNAEIMLVYDRSIKKKLIAGVHFVETKDDGVYADVYYPFKSERVVRVNGDWQHQEEYDTEYPYSSVPIIHFKGNRRMTPLFQAEKPLIDAHDELISKSLNEVDRFNAVITLLGKKVSPEFADKLKQGLISIIDDLNTNGDNENWPQYLEKNLGGVNDFYNKLADRLERLYHKSVKIPDMTDEAFAGQQSGIAIAFKLIGMEFKASQIETYFNQGLKKRLDLYGDVYNASSNKVDVGLYEANIQSKRNLPVDDKAKAEIAQLLQGILSEETLLKILPRTIVPDPKKEMEKKKEEEPDSTVEFDDITGE